MHWSLRRALEECLSPEEIERIEIRAERIRRDAEPDGAIMYVPESREYAMRGLVSRHMDSLE